MLWVLCCARACSYKKAGECSVGVRPNLKCEQDDDDDDEQSLMPCPEVWFFPTGIGLVGLSTPICFVSTPSVIISRSLGRDTFSKRQINNIVEESYRSVSAWSTTPIPLIQVLEGHALFLGVFVGMWVGRLGFFFIVSFLWILHYFISIFALLQVQLAGTSLQAAAQSLNVQVKRVTFCCSSFSHPKQHQQRQFLTCDILLCFFQSDQFCK